MNITNNEIKTIEETINYTFKNKMLLENALIHSSFSHENNLEIKDNNERLEFLGDAVVELTVSRFLFDNFGSMAEGDMTKFRAGIVCESSLSSYARQLNFGDYIKMGKGEEMSGGKNRDSILCDLFEAIIGAIYLDSDFETVRDVILSIMKTDILTQQDAFICFDYKTSLQEIIQKDSKTPISYRIVNELGPDHAKVFISQVIHESRILGEGRGKSKKESEQSAAQNAIEKIKI